MLNKRYKKIIKTNFFTYLGMIILITLSVSCYLSMKTASVSITNNVKDNRIIANLEDARFDLYGFLDDKKIREYEDKYKLDIEKISSIDIDKAYKNATIRFTKNRNTINLITVYNGRNIKSNNEILVDKYFYNANKLSINDNITINNKVYKIVGTFTTPDNLSLLKLETDFITDGNKFGFIVLSNDEYDKLPSENEETFYAIKYTEDNEETFRKDLSKEVYIKSYLKYENNKRITTFDGESEGMVGISIIAPIVILLLSSIILSVVLARMLKKEYIYIGTLSAMGYKKSEIMKHYLFIPIVLSIISSIMGIIIGFLLIDPFKILLALEYNVPKPIYKVEFYDVLLVLLVPLILNIILCYLSIKKALEINIITLLKGDKDNKGKKILKKFRFKKIKFQNKFKIKELIANIPRTITMIVGLIISFMLLLTGFLFSSACDFIYETSYPEIYGYKYQYLYKNIQTANGPYEKYMLANFSYNGNGFIIQGIDVNNNDFIKPKDEKGNYIDINKTIIPKSVAKRLKINKGAKIKIINDITLKEVEMVVDEITDIKIGNIVYMPLSKLNNILDINPDSYIGVYTNKLVNMDAHLIKDIITLEDSKAGMEFAIKLFNTFLVILAFVSGIVSIIVVLIVSSLLIEENFKNISTLKVLGYSNKEISNILLKSSNIILPISFILSIPITKKLITIFFNEITKNMYFDFNINIKIEQYIISFVVIFIFTNIAIIISKKKINKVNLAESLKFSE